jgi:alcohol dehydrogenase YqhD (iron-dependent ADH family)
MKHDVMRFAQVAVRVWGCEMDYANPEITAMNGIERLKQFSKSIGMPVTFEELGAREEDIPALAAKLELGDGTMGSFVPLTTKDVEAIYRLAL